MAEAISKLHATDVFEAYSAGTERKPQINGDAVRLIKQLFNVDMEKDQFSKLISDIPQPDIVITMGCNVNCPILPCRFREDWGLEDPTGKSDEEFLMIVKTIENRIMELKERILNKKI